MTTLVLPAAPPVLFFFGLAGAGKTHVGQLVSTLTGWPLYDADADISPAMQQALAEQRPFTEAMREEFFPRVVNRIRALQQQHAHVVVTQGVYKQRHRDYLLREIPVMAMVCVTCSEAVLQQRLAGRTRGISPASAAALLADFEPPAPGTPLIRNDGDDADIVRQLTGFYAT